MSTISRTTDPETLFDRGLRVATANDASRHYVEAHKWFNLAAMAGSAEARTLRAELARDMTAVQIAEAQRQARQWLSATVH